MKYRFTIDGRATGPWRDQWLEAAHDAAAAGYGTWLSYDGIALDEQAEIERGTRTEQEQIPNT